MKDEKKFNVWMLSVDRRLDGLCGMESSELPDKDWWDWWAEGLTPSAAAQRAIDSEGGLEPVGLRRHERDVSELSRIVGEY